MPGQAMTVNWGVGDYVRNIKRFDGTGMTNTFDNAGRLAKVQYPSEYHLFNWTANGLLTQLTGKTCNLSNRFDALGRLNYQQHVLGGRTNVVTYQFDPVGNVTNVAVSNTPVRFAWTFDAAERPVTLAAYPVPAVAGVFRWNYSTNNGLAASVTNGVVGEFLGFDVMDRATNITWKTAGGTTVRGFGYSFNAAGMITNVSRENGGWITYTYDSLDRLLSEKQYASTGLTYSASWAYDLAGNRTMAVTDGVTNLYSYAAGNSLTNFGAGTLVQYDLAGNTTNLQYSASRKLGLVWDGKYQLVEVRTNGVLVEKYDYDPLGRRVRITAGTVTNTMVYDGPHVVAEYSNNVLARSYAYGPGIDDALSLTTYGGTTNTYYYLKDNLGSVHALVNTNGAVVEQYRYTAWGEVTVLSSNGTVLAASAYGNSVMWQGREYSAKTGLLFFRSRYYLASIGRWLSKDKIGITGGSNLYMAFWNAPTVYGDPDGCDAYIVVTEGHLGLLVDAGKGYYRSYDFSMATRGLALGEYARYKNGSSGLVRSSIYDVEAAKKVKASALAIWRVKGTDESAMILEILKQVNHPPEYGEESGVCVQRALSLVTLGNSAVAFPSFAAETRQMAWSTEPLIAAIDAHAKNKVNANYDWVIRVKCGY